MLILGTCPLQATHNAPQVGIDLVCTVRGLHPDRLGRGLDSRPCTCLLHLHVGSLTSSQLKLMSYLRWLEDSGCGSHQRRAGQSPDRRGRRTAGGKLPRFHPKSALAVSSSSQHIDSLPIQRDQTHHRCFHNLFRAIASSAAFTCTAFACALWSVIEPSLT